LERTSENSKSEHGVILPYHGDSSRHRTNIDSKKIIIQQFVRNIPTPEIARRTSHSEEACDGHIKRFKMILKLHGDGIPAENIASEQEMSKSLVREYVEIIEDLAQTRKGSKG
jgi:hypothetical protein